MSHEQIADELAHIQHANGGLLRPADVVAFARNEDTALHSKFEWDDTEAAAKWRLVQAREVIRLNVTIIGDNAGPVRAFVSLSSDRATKGGGYRATVDVLSDDIRRSEMLADALDELRSVKRKYEKLRALKPVWDALDSVDDSSSQKVAAG